MNTSTETRTEFVVRHLRAAKPKNWPTIAQKTGVAERTLAKIAYHETKDPRCSTVDPLVAYFEKNPAAPEKPFVA
jgi:hypothetical protein